MLATALTVTLAAVVPAGVSAQQAAPSAVDLPAPRIAGVDREATSAALLGLARDHGVDGTAVVVTPAASPVLALVASGLAGTLGGGVVLSGDRPSPAVRAAVDQVATEVVVVGGTDALATAWAAEGRTVTRVGVAGSPPAAVAASVAQALAARAGRPPDRLLLVGEDGVADALAAAGWAHAERLPVLLTAADSLSADAGEAIRSLGVSQVVVLGGTAVVGDAVLDQVRAMGVDVRRLAGATRGETAVAVALARGVSLAHVVLAASPADAAAVGPYAGRVGAAVLPPGTEARGALAERCGTGVLVQVVGGRATVPVGVEWAHRAAAERCDPDGPVEVRIAVAAPDVPDAADVVLAAVTDPRGWASRRITLTASGDDHTLGLLVVDDACGGPAVCRRGRDVGIDASAWRVAGPEGRTALANLAIAHRLGVAPDPVCGTGRLTLLACAAPPDPWPGPTRAAAVADLLIPGATLAFGGDVHAERHIGDAVRRGGNPLAPVAPILSAPDLAVVNLETPLSTRGAPVPKTFTFRGPPEMAERLVAAGVDVVSLANNHGLDYGHVAMLDTLDHAAAAGLRVVGAGPDPATAYAASLHDTPAGRVAVVGLTRVLHTRTWEVAPGRPGMASAYDEAAAVEAVRTAAAQADHVVVAIHWGTERAGCPDAAQRHLAPLLVDAGADLVVGHHPHVLQGVQVLDGALVAYSLGNFVWYHNRAPSRFTGVLEVDLPLLDAPSWRVVPAEIGVDGSPHPVTAGSGAAITGTVAARSPGGAAGCAFPR